jgi:hypothetical protein
MNILIKHKKALVVSVAVGLYLKYLLIPTGVLFYELYHATGVGFIYWGYSIFKAAGYFFGVWQYQTLACVLVTLSLFAIAVLRGARTHNTENAS